MKTWFITGASSGIGRSVAEKLLARGDRVAATVRRPAALDDLRAAHGERLRVVTLDLTDTGAMRREVDEAFSAFGPIDVVLSNAGYGLFGAAEEVTDAQIERQIATNLTGSIQLVRACLPHLRRQGGGRVLQTSSEGGQVTYPGFSLYHASKWGIEGFIEAVAQEVAAFGIDMIIVEPGPTRTRFGANVDRAEAMEAYADTPAGQVRQAIASASFPRTGDPERCADAMIEAADADRPPRRLVLGSVAYNHIEQTLADRLDQIRGQKAVAFSADYLSEIKTA
jgi:NAD(P)-dependent dehydrogenase (short-subunit alcohol dehydrogenase family)